MDGQSDLSQEQLALAARDAAHLMRALSNPSRMLLLCQLVETERTVGEMEDALGLGQAYVSQQLARLRDEGLVQATRDGRQMRYRLTDERVAPILAAIHDQFCPKPA